MLNSLTPFLIQWAVTALSLWVASYLFKGLRFEGTGSLVVAALVLGFANALVKPLLIVLTFPLTLLTFGLLLLVINALRILPPAAPRGGAQPWVRWWAVATRLPRSSCRREPAAGFEPSRYWPKSSGSPT